MSLYKSKMQEEWYKMMRAKYDTDDAGVREIMGKHGKAGVTKRQKDLEASGKKHRGGFSNPEFAKEMGARGKKSRYNNDNESN